MAEPLPIDRVSADDLMSLATERGTTPTQVGAVLFLDTSSWPDTAAGLDAERVLALLARRLPGVPRLRQRLVTLPFGCGRPIWVDDPAFDASRHVSVVACPAPGGEQAVLDLAATLLVTPLPRTRALWVATLVTGVAEHEAALIVVLHHVLADGVAGLAVLAGLVDGAAAGGLEGGESGFPRPQASVRRLAIDAWTRRLGSVRRMPALLHRIRAAAIELGSVRWTRLRPTSLNVPTGPRRRFATVTVPLDGIRASGRTQDATVNDVVLTAIGGAVHRLLARRGESEDRFIISVPFSERRDATAGELGNRSGVIPIRVPGRGDPARRLRFVAGGTRAAKRSTPGATTALLGPYFRLLARIGLFQWFVDRQRLIHTFVSNMRGPEHRLSILGCPVTAIVPLSAATGNVTVSFAVLSYAGALTITLVADPDACPDLAVLQRLLAEELTGLGALAG